MEQRGAQRRVGLLGWTAVVFLVGAGPLWAARGTAVKQAPGASFANFVPGDDYPDIVDAAAVVPGLRVELAYASKDNFLRRNIYGGQLTTCWLHRRAAAMLAQAELGLRGRADGALQFMALDCLRPRRAQIVMWGLVKGTPQQSYVADPNTSTASLHNYGCAIDLTLARGADGQRLDMGTPFDHFGPLAQPRRETQLRGSGELTAEALANRLLLREVMVRAGFLPIGNEWWHFNCAPAGEVRASFRILE